MVPEQGEVMQQFPSSSSSVRDPPSAYHGNESRSTNRIEDQEEGEDGMQMIGSFGSDLLAALHEDHVRAAAAAQAEKKMAQASASSFRKGNNNQHQHQHRRFAVPRSRQQRGEVAAAAAEGAEAITEEEAAAKREQQQQLFLSGNNNTRSPPVDAHLRDQSSSSSSRPNLSLHPHRYARGLKDSCRLVVAEKYNNNNNNHNCNHNRNNKKFCGNQGAQDVEMGDYERGGAREERGHGGGGGGRGGFNRKRRQRGMRVPALVCKPLYQSHLY